MLRTMSPKQRSCCSGLAFLGDHSFPVPTPGFQREYLSPKTCTHSNVIENGAMFTAALTRFANSFCGINKDFQRKHEQVRVSAKDAAGSR